MDLLQTRLVVNLSKSVRLWNGVVFPPFTFASWCLKTFVHYESCIFIIEVVTCCQSLVLFSNNSSIFSAYYASLVALTISAKEVKVKWNNFHSTLRYFYLIWSFAIHMFFVLLMYMYSHQGVDPCADPRLGAKDLEVVSKRCAPINGSDFAACHAVNQTVLPFHKFQAACERDLCAGLLDGADVHTCPCATATEYARQCKMFSAVAAKTLSWRRSDYCRKLFELCHSIAQSRL